MSIFVLMCAKLSVENKKSFKNLWPVFGMSSYMNLMIKYGKVGCTLTFFKFIGKRVSRVPFSVELKPSFM